MHPKQLALRIPPIVLNMYFPELSPVRVTLYNKCLSESCFPSCWKSSSVVPVFKNEEKSDPGRYRPILPIISKIFESFINDSLTKHLHITGLFSDLQYGFRSCCSTAGILTVLSEHIYNSLNSFANVWHAGCLHKLKTYAVVGPHPKYFGIFFVGTFIENCS